MKKLLLITAMLCIAPFFSVAQNQNNTKDYSLHVSMDGKNVIKEPHKNNSKATLAKIQGGVVMPQYLSVLYADSLGTWLPDDSLQTFNAKYTENGTLDTVVIMEGATLDTVGRIGFIFDTEGEPIEDIKEEYLGNNTWINSNRYIYYHDDHGNDTLIADFIWNEALMEWEITWGEKHVFFYDAEGRITEDIRLYYDSFDSLWNPQERFEYSYNMVLGNLEIVETRSFYDVGGWVFNERVTFSFNSALEVDEVLAESWDPTNSAWVNNVLITDFVWHAFYGLQNQFEWDEEDGGFYDINITGENKDFDMLFEIFYLMDFHQQNKIESCLVQEWDDAAGSWINLERFSYQFDQYGGFIGFKEKEFSGVWENFEKYELVMNAMGHAEAYYNYDWEINDWVLQGGPQFNLTYEGDQITNVVYQEYDYETDNYINQQEESYWDFVTFASNCQAGFEIVVNDLNVAFMNTSTGNYSEVLWDFGNGDVSDTTAMAFEYVYDEAGYYDVSLMIYDEATNTYDDTTTTILVGTSPNSCMASYEYTSSGLTYAFTNTSQGNITHFYWEFGDGSVSLQENPTHTYQVDGYYYVILTVYDQQNGCMDIYEELVEVGDPSNDCEADFDYFADPQTRIVYFTNNSQAAVIDNNFWNFGDGFTSAMTNPIHQYGEEGFYPVCLSIWDNAGNCYNTSCQTIHVEGDNACNASFMHSLDSANNTVTFVDYSVGDIISWEYDFGDGTGASTANAIHTYVDTGMYLVHLHIITSTGCNSDFFKLVNANSSYQGVMGMFGYVQEEGGKGKGQPVDFKGAVYGEPSRTIWTFGDGESDSTTLYPTHNYSQPGVYNVCLKVTQNALGQTHTYCKNITVGPESAEQFSNKNFSARVFPNPFSEQANIEVYLDNATKIRIELFDILGNRVHEIANYTASEGINTYQLNKGELENGLYLLKITSKDEIYTERIILSK